MVFNRKCSASLKNLKGLLMNSLNAITIDSYGAMLSLLKKKILFSNDPKFNLLSC